MLDIWTESSLALDSNFDWGSCLGHVGTEGPSLAPLLTRILSAGLNLTAAASLFRRAAALRRAAAQGALDTSAVAELNRDGDRLGLRAVGDEAIAGITGAAQAPATRPWRVNEGGRIRKSVEVRDLVTRHGIDVPDDIVFYAVNQKDLPPDATASYFGYKPKSNNELVPWTKFYNANDEIPVRLSKEIMNSDEAIIAVVAHEMYELNALRDLFEQRGGSLPALELHRLIVAERPGNLHDHAWDEADRVIQSIRTERP